MRTAKTTLLAGIAALALAGSCGLALAGGPARHEMTVQLPDGGTARIEYIGKVAPKVTFGANPFAAAFFGPASPFAELDRISAQMDRQMAAMMSGRAWTPMPFADPNPLFEANLRGSAPGSHGYAMTTSLSGSGFCMQSVEITRTGNAKPKVVSHSAGNCGHAHATGLTTKADGASRPLPIGTWTRETAPGPTVHEVAYQPRN